MNITKTQLESDLHALKQALRLSDYDPLLIIKEYEAKHGKYSERNIKKRVRKEVLRPGAQETLDNIASFSEKACGEFK